MKLLSAAIAALIVISCGGDSKKVNRFDDTHDTTEAPSKEQKPQPEMTADKRKVVEDFGEAMVRHDWKALESLIDESLVIAITRYGDERPVSEQRIPTIGHLKAGFLGFEFFGGTLVECRENCCSFESTELKVAHHLAYEKICVSPKTSKIIKVDTNMAEVGNPVVGLKKGERFRPMLGVMANPTVWVAPDGTQVSFGVVSTRGKEGADKGVVRVSINGKDKDILKFNGDGRVMSSIDVIFDDKDIVIVDGEYGKQGDGQKRATKFEWDAKRQRLESTQKWDGKFLSDPPEWARRRQPVATL